MWFKHSMSIAQQLIPIYNTTVHKNKTNVALNVVSCLCHNFTRATDHGGGDVTGGPWKVCVLTVWMNVDFKNIYNRDIVQMKI